MASIIGGSWPELDYITSSRAGMTIAGGELRRVAAGLRKVSHRHECLCQYNADKAVMSQRLMFCVSVAMLCAAADKKLPIDETSNDLLDISVSAPLDKDQIKQELGSDLGADIIVIRLTARPVSDKPVQLSLDDFLLISGKDGQRSEPFAPGQLAGSDSLIVTPRWNAQGAGRPSESAVHRIRRHRNWRRRGGQFRRNSNPGRESRGIA